MTRNRAKPPSQLDGPAGKDAQTRVTGEERECSDGRGRQ